MSTFYILTLGCSKNRVDSEYAVTLLSAAGHRQVDDPQRADWVLINTCAFIEDARVESIDTLLAFAEERYEGQKIAALGCLVQRYAGELQEALAEVDGFVGTSAIGEIVQMMNDPSRLYRHDSPASWIPDRFIPRESSVDHPVAYLKIAEGCDRRCAFCSIP